MRYEVEFTPLAKAFAEAKASVALVEEHVRADLDALACAPLEILFHVCTVAETDFMVTPRDGKMLVDMVLYEESEPLQDGPFKGLRVMFPRRAGEE